MSHVAHLAAAVDGVENAGGNAAAGLRDFHLGIFHQGDEQRRCCGVTCDALHATLAAAIHLADGSVDKGCHERLVAHGAAFHLDGGLAVDVGGAHVVTHRHAVQAGARHGMTAATEDGAIDIAAVHLDVGVACHTACGIIHLLEVTSAAKDVAAPSGDSARCA